MATIISQMTDVSRGTMADGWAVRISLTFDRLEPPMGAATVVRGGSTAKSVRFDGWLGLLRALYELLPARAGSRSAKGDT